MHGKHRMQIDFRRAVVKQILRKVIKKRQLAADFVAGSILKVALITPSIQIERIREDRSILRPGTEVIS